MGRKFQKWSIGDVFTVPLLDGRYGVGQVVGREADVLNSVSVAFFDRTCDDPTEALSIDRTEDRVFSVVFATREQLDRGSWKVVGNEPVAIPTRLLPHEDKRSSRFVGAAVFGTKILDEFLNAYFGLTWWDDWKDPNYLDALLVSPTKKPDKVLLKSMAR